MPQKSAFLFGLVIATVMLLDGCTATTEPMGAPVPSGPDAAVRARCEAADWRATGYRHGISGYPLSAMTALGSRCKAAGAHFDRLSYSTGRLEGLQKFCSPENGYRIGVSGGARPEVCPERMQPAFVSAFRAGASARR